ncbi:pyrrolo-quinoline quinone [Natronolimnohabitans innermongolicus JCM 12255]|uniref:Pyrrolo-quinoline quinone n=1 Tax=Natronolimnohabitans innermongolicus JCM 12255 TaxID=1227499 RepID=L9WRQ6_9EURY|nr:pyrrolo-quinoline quinone [Natronolimnohabitans innermongolicus JCM 12255]
MDSDAEAIIWEETISEVQHIAVGADETLYVSHKTNNGHDYEVVAFDVEKDEAVWTYSPPGNVDTGRELMVRDGMVYTHELDTVLAIDGETGEGETIVVYNDDGDGSVAAGRAPTIADDIIYSAGVFDQRAVLTRKLDTGEEPQSWDTSELPPGPTGRRLFVSDDTLYTWRGYGYVDLYALNPKTGESRWSFNVREHQEMARGTVQGYAILENVLVYTIEGNYSVVGTFESA